MHSAWHSAALLAQKQKVSKQSTFFKLQPLLLSTVTRHKASTSTRLHFAFSATLSYNKTRALIANPPWNSAQLEGTLYHSPKLHPGLCSSVDMWQGQTERHTDRHTDIRDQCTFRLSYASCDM